MYISFLYKSIFPRNTYAKIENYHTFTKVFELPHTTKGIWAYGQTIDTRTGRKVVQNDVTQFVLLMQFLNTEIENQRYIEIF